MTVSSHCAERVMSDIRARCSLDHGAAAAAADDAAMKFKYDCAVHCDGPGADASGDQSKSATSIDRAWQPGAPPEFSPAPRGATDLRLLQKSVSKQSPLWYPTSGAQYDDTSVQKD